LRRLKPRQHDDSTGPCTIFLRGLTAGPHPLPHSSGAAEFFAVARVKRTQVFFASMLEVAISSAFLATCANKRGNFQNCRTIARGTMPAKQAGGG
jgi:hypothetical protein